MKDNQTVSPFIIEKTYGSGKILFANVAGYFKSVSDSPQKIFPLLGEIPSLTGLDLEKFKKEMGTVTATSPPHYVGNLNATGSVRIESSSLLVSESSGFDISVPQGEQAIFGGSQNQTAMQVTGLQIVGPTTILLNSINLFSALDSQYGYVSLIFPHGFNMTAEISKGSDIQIFTHNNDEMVKIPSDKIQGNQIRIQSLSRVDPSLTPDVVLMREPIIQVNGTTSFDELHANDPKYPTKPLADGVPVTINGTFMAKFSHLDVKPYNPKISITYFKWIKFNGTANVADKPHNIYQRILEIPWTGAMQSELNIGIQLIIPAAAVLTIVAKNVIGKKK